MANSDTDSDISWVFADVESDSQEQSENGFCLLKAENDSVSDADVGAELEDCGDADVEDSFDEPEVSFLLCKSTAKSPEDCLKFLKYVDMKKEARIEDVVREHALHFLPAKSLCKFRTVSRGWDQWINNPFFAHRQTTYFRKNCGLFCQVPGDKPSFISFNQDAYGMPDPSLCFLPEPVNIRSSCNGLLCCQSIGDNVYYICNPVTKQWRVLPRPTLYHGAEAAVVLAFEPHPLNFNEAYELVCTVPVPVPDSTIVYFEIYSSRSSSWRVSDTTCCELYSSELHSSGYYLNGVVYWEASSGVILAFILRSEEYGVLPLPSGAGEHGSLTVMNGELCYILPRLEDDDCNVYIYGNMDMRLKTVIRLSFDAVGSIFGVCRALPSVNDDVLILALGRKVIAYHVREEKAELIRTAEVASCVTCLPYVNSLIQIRHPLVDPWA